MAEGREICLKSSFRQRSDEFDFLQGTGQDRDGEDNFCNGRGLRSGNEGFHELVLYRTTHV
jgi:hypothetical protein